MKALITLADVEIAVRLNAALEQADFRSGDIDTGFNHFFNYFGLICHIHSQNIL